jgi:Calcineurin-like phosphoesterase
VSPSVFLLRGNHECSDMSMAYGFYAECVAKCSPGAWAEVCAAFDVLPVAALVGGRIFCVHGGPSPMLSSLADINRISRPTAITQVGAGSTQRACGKRVGQFIGAHGARVGGSVPQGCARPVDRPIGTDRVAPAVAGGAGA